MAKVKKDEYFVIHTDGSCKDGVGGWSYTIKTKKRTYEGSGCAENTSSMRMELTAIIEALKRIQKSGNKQVVVVTDCRNIVQICNSGRLHRYSLEGWVFTDGRVNADQDLWRELAKYLSIHNAKLQWIRSHSTNNKNNLCDEKARMARVSMAKAGAEF